MSPVSGENRDSERSSHLPTVTQHRERPSVQAGWTRVASRLLECRRGHQQGPVKDAGLLLGAQR